MHRIGRLVSGTSHSIATLSQAVTASCHAMPGQHHAGRLPGHANTEGSREFVGTHQTNTGSQHAIPVSDHRPSSYAAARPHANSATNHAIPIQSRPNSGPNLEIPGHVFTRNDDANFDPKHATAVSSHADFRPIQTGQGIDAFPPPRQGASGYSIPRTSDNILAQSCPTFTAPRLTSLEEYPGFALRTVQPGAPSVRGETRTTSSTHSNAYQNKYVAPSKFQESRPMSAPHGTQNVFDYQDVGADEFHVVSDVYNQGGTQMRRTRGSSGPSQRQVYILNGFYLQGVVPS